MKKSRILTLLSYMWLTICLLNMYVLLSTPTFYVPAAFSAWISIAMYLWDSRLAEKCKLAEEAK